CAPVVKDARPGAGFEPRGGVTRAKVEHMDVRAARVPSESGGPEGRSRASAPGLETGSGPQDVAETRGRRRIRATTRIREKTRNSMELREKIPNNVNLSEDPKLLRALEKWLPDYQQWWMEMGPEGYQDYEVYLRTAISVDAKGWAHFDYVRMPEYRWGIFLA